MQPVPLCDRLEMDRAGKGVVLTCSDESLPVDNGNLVFKAAVRFLEAAEITDGVRLHLTKHLPVAAGLGGGSANAAVTLRGLNRLFEQPLSPGRLTEIAAELGSDVPFFLQDGPALCTGRGERIQPLEPFPALQGKAILLIRPGFGVSTGWAYQALAGYPEGVNGVPGRGAALVARLREGSLSEAADGFFNSLEAPVFEKYPWLALLKEALTSNGALVAMMSGSGSTTFAITESAAAADQLCERVLSKLGGNCWTQTATF